MAVLDTIYNTFFKRTTTYLPLLFVGAYFSNEALDAAVAGYWNSHNRGKSFAEMVAAREAA